jgi:uncharacterized membrane protein
MVTGTDRGRNGGRAEEAEAPLNAAPRARDSSRKFRNAIDVAAIEAAIDRMRRTTTGDLRVVISPAFWGNVRHNADRALALVGHGRAARNGVLLFIVPRRREFAIVGDAGIHALAGEDLWTGVRDRLGEAFRSGRYTEGIIEAVETIGASLSRHFPKPAAAPAKPPI